MSVKNTFYSQLLTGQSLASSFNGPVSICRNYDNISYQIDVTTTNSVGSFSVQVSNDYALGPDALVSNPGTWITLTLSGTPTVNTANDIIGISLNQVPFNAIRLVYTSVTPGTGTCSVAITGKRLGG